MTHTLAPWTMNADPYDDGTPYFRFEAGKPYEDVSEGFRFTAIMQLDDANLILAAPELLEALRHLHTEAVWMCKQLDARGLPGVPGDTVDMAIMAAREAIAKANGHG